VRVEPKIIVNWFEERTGFVPVGGARQ